MRPSRKWPGQASLRTNSGKVLRQKSRKGGIPNQSTCRYISTGRENIEPKIATGEKKVREHNRGGVSNLQGILTKK